MVGEILKLGKLRRRHRAVAENKRTEPSRQMPQSNSVPLNSRAIGIGEWFGGELASVTETSVGIGALRAPAARRG